MTPHPVPRLLGLAVTAALLLPGCADSQTQASAAVGQAGAAVATGQLALTQLREDRLPRASAKVALAESRSEVAQSLSDLADLPDEVPQYRQAMRLVQRAADALAASERRLLATSGPPGPAELRRLSVVAEDLSELGQELGRPR